MVKDILKKSIAIATECGEDDIARGSVIKYREHIQNLTYKDMNNFYYYAITLGLFALEVFLAIILDDIGTIFNYLSAITVTFLGFWFPAFFFIYAEKKFPNHKLYQSNLFHRIMAYFHIFLGLIIFVLSISSNIITLY